MRFYIYLERERAIGLVFFHSYLWYTSALFCWRVIIYLFGMC